jgi:hypothetical protein
MVKVPKGLEAAAKNAAKVMLMQQISEMESHAHALGMIITARGLNNAKNACGWEIAGNTDAADKATRGERTK